MTLFKHHCRHVLTNLLLTAGLLLVIPYSKLADTSGPQTRVRARYNRTANILLLDLTNLYDAPLSTQHIWFRQTAKASLYSRYGDYLQTPFKKLRLRSNAEKTDG